MNLKWNSSTFYGVAILIMLLLVSGRFIIGGYDFSYFMVGGTDFIDASQTPHAVTVQQGQGYDGQFFYRYAHNPLDFSKTNYGVTVDLVPYRIQRIGYPLLAWIFSFGGTPSLVSFSLILVNILAFLGIIYFTNRIIKFTNGNTMHLALPFFLCGIYMSVAKDLAEVTELFFFLGAILFYLNSSFKNFAFFASMTVLCRETSLVAFLPLIIYSLFLEFKNKRSLLNLVWVSVPVFVFISWKYWISIHVDSGAVVQGSGNLGIPFKGIMEGFRGNLDISTNKNILQLGFWILYFLWQLWLLVKVLSCMKFAFASKDPFLKPLTLVYLTWLVFAVFLSAAIYVDDWSFVRVFSLWSMTGFLILILAKKSIGNVFTFYSVILVCLTLGRLIIRP